MKVYKYKNKEYYFLAELPLQSQYKDKWDNSVFYKDDTNYYIRNKNEFYEKFKFTKEIDNSFEDNDNECMFPTYEYCKEILELRLSQTFCKDYKNKPIFNDSLELVLIEILNTLGLKKEILEEIGG